MTLVIMLAGLGLTSFDGWIAARFGTYGTLFDVKELAQVVVWLVAGQLARRIRPHTPIGPLMMLLGLLLATTAPAALALVADPQRLPETGHPWTTEQQPPGERRAHLPGTPAPRQMT